jgi:hypothetical protein
MFLIIGLLIASGAVISDLYASRTTMLSSEISTITAPAQTYAYSSFLDTYADATSTGSITQTNTGIQGTCPYGGTYYAYIHTSLCGWQSSVCVSFDYNCADDYPAVWVGYTTTSTQSSTSTDYAFYTASTSYGITTNIMQLVTSEGRPLSDELNPFLVTLSIVGLSMAVYGVLLDREERK